jgi:hypothetical protein
MNIIQLLLGGVYVIAATDPGFSSYLFVHYKGYINTQALQTYSVTCFIYFKKFEFNFFGYTRLYLFQFGVY